MKSHLCAKEGSAWEAGTGRDHVRAILAGPPKVSQLSAASDRDPFLIGDTYEESDE